MSFFKKKHLYLFFVIFLFTSCKNPTKNPYSSIKDITKPTVKDYKNLQKHFKKGKRDYLSLFSKSSQKGGNLLGENYTKKAKKFRFLNKKNKKPTFEKICYNTTATEKDICIICYSSFNRNYPDGIERIKKALSLINYKGHFIYRIGGWPNLNEGSLRYSHVLFAFKPFLFREVKNLGYKKVLWLDSAVIPLKPLGNIFKKIETNGYYGFIGNDPVSLYSNDYVLDLFNTSLKEAENMKTVGGGIIGLNLSSSIGVAILDRWQYAAENGGFFSPRHDQTAISIIASQLNLKNFEVTLPTFPYDLKDLKKESIFFLDRSISYWPFIQKDHSIKLVKQEKVKEKRFKDLFKLKNIAKNKVGKNLR